LGGGEKAEGVQESEWKYRTPYQRQKNCQKGKIPDAWNKDYGDLWGGREKKREKAEKKEEKGLFKKEAEPPMGRKNG